LTRQRRRPHRQREHAHGLACSTRAKQTLPGGGSRVLHRPRGMLCTRHGRTTPRSQPAASPAGRLLPTPGTQRGPTNSISSPLPPRVSRAGLQQLSAFSWLNLSESQVRNSGRARRSRGREPGSTGASTETACRGPSVQRGPRLQARRRGGVLRQCRGSTGNRSNRKNFQTCRPKSKISNTLRALVTVIRG